MLTQLLMLSSFNVETQWNNIFKACKMVYTHIMHNLVYIS